jgi:Uncharacterized protein conserved in bacteria
MAQDFSFDIVSEVDLQVIDDVVNVTVKEISNRFDLKGKGIELTLNRGEKIITVLAPSEFMAKQAMDILSQKMSKRNVSSKALSLKKKEDTSGGFIRETHTVINGIDMELAKTIVKDIKILGLRIQAAIQDEKIRVSGKDKDELQKVIHAVRETDYPIPIQFTNYR